MSCLIAHLLSWLQRVCVHYRPHDSVFGVILFSFFSSSRFVSEAEMWPRSVRRFGGVLIGIVVGSGVVGLLVAWTNVGFYMTTSTSRIMPGKENIGLILFLQMSPLCRYV